MKPAEAKRKAQLMGHDPGNYSRDRTYRDKETNFGEVRCRCRNSGCMGTMYKQDDDVTGFMLVYECQRSTNGE